MNSAKNLNQQIFLAKYNISETEFKKSGLQWSDIKKIYEDFISIRTELQLTANNVAENLSSIQEVHSIRQRIKDPEHLLEKIIRKKLTDSTFNIDVSNYQENISDLIGVRALHLFKEDWVVIHNFITNTWDLKEDPVVNVREGDSEGLIDKFRERKCQIKMHPYGYRSIHYSIKTQATKQTRIVEIQVRTLFEEGWSEIDHKLRYPNAFCNDSIIRFLIVFNRLVGSADEMGSYAMFLKKTMDVDKDVYLHKLEEKDKEIAILRSHIENIEKQQISPEEKETLPEFINLLTDTKQPLGLVGLGHQLKRKDWPWSSSYRDETEKVKNRSIH